MPSRCPVPWISLVALALLGLGGGSALAQDCTFIAEGTTWLWHADPPPVDWAELAAEDDPERSAWQAGCTPYSSGGCGFSPGTFWTPGTTIFVRQHVWLTGAETGLEASIAIDNDFELWVNGVFVRALVHEGCATRWDAVIPVPDGLWQIGDNVVAVQLVDRGGITNFEMILTGSSADPCPSECSLLPCGEPGPAVLAPEGEPCPGQILPVRAESAGGPPCPTSLEYRYRDTSGLVVRDWGPPEWFVVVGEEPVALTVEARCSHSPTCPVGADDGAFVPPPGPPPDPGPTLRATTAPGGVLLTWTDAPALVAGEHDHVIASSRAHGIFRRVNGEGETSRGWLDSRPGAPWHYLVRVADDC